MAEEKKNYIKIPKWGAIVAAILFVGGMVTVGLCVYYLAPAPSAEEVTTFNPGATTNGPEATTNRPGATTISPDHEEYRLPKNVLPDKYEVELLPFLENGNFTFNGKVKISVTCVESTDVIILHYRDMTIISMVEVSEDGAPLEVISTKYNSINNQFQIRMGVAIKAGAQYTISMSFIGNINSDLEGFYRDSYIDAQGATRWLGITQFEAIGARRAFPCFDEPTFKAKFKLTLGRTMNRTTIANVNAIQLDVPVEGVPGMVWDIYEETPQKMSTYLVAFAVSDFVKFPGRNTSNGVPTSTIANPLYTKEQADLSVGVTPDILEFYERYTGIPYAFPKLDNVAVNQFSFGAMENWGLVLYRDTLLMYDGPKKTTASTYKRIIQIIAHELAHQWFGNLVTMEFWSANFLNEGFATLFEHKGLEAVRPDWKTDEIFIAETLQPVMRGLDSMNSSRPMFQPINDNDIMKFFDDIAYEKSGSVLRMIEATLGDATFQKGIRNYLQARKFMNAEVSDLVFHLNAAAVEDNVILPTGGLETVTDTWVYQKNFPVITVKRQLGSGTVTVTQKRFLRDPYPRSAEDYFWWIPLTYTQDFTDVKKAWLPNNAEPVEFTGLTDNKFVIFNVGQKGYYRVNYDESNWRLISEALSSDPSSIELFNRAQILDDALNLAQQGYVSYSTAMDMTRFLKDEVEWLPWSTFDANAIFLDNLLSGQGAYSNFRVYLLRLVKPLYESLTFEEDADDDILKLFSRTLAVKWACKFGLPDCKSNSDRLYDQWVGAEGVETEIIPPNLKSTILCTAIRNGDDVDFQNAVDILRTPTDKASVASALTCATDVILLDRLFTYTITETDSPIVKGSSDITDAIYRNVANNPTGRTQAFRFITTKWEDIKTFYSSAVAARWLTFVTAYFSTESELNELIAFRNEHSAESGIVAALEQAVERAEANVRWASNYYTDLADWLENEVA